MTSLIESLSEMARRYEDRKTLDLSADRSDPETALTRWLLYYLLPMWTTVGLVDWWWHKETDIEHTSGTKESLIHLLMFTEAGLPLLMGLFWEVNAAVISTMVAALVAHESTAFWDVGYAIGHREVKTREQHTHSFLEILPLTAIALTTSLHWDQVRALAGKGKKPPDFSIRFKKRKLPATYLAAVAGMIVGGIVLPYGNELYRCVRARNEPHYNSGFYEDGKRRGS